MQREHLGGVETWWGPQFEALYFVPMPQPNHTKRIEELLAAPKKEEPKRLPVFSRQF